MKACGGKGVHIDDDPQWDASIHHSGNLPPNTAIINKMDLGCDPMHPTDHPTPSLEGYWDRDDVNGYLYPKQLDDEVLINYTAPFYDEQFGVSGKIYTTAGYMMGPGTQLIFASNSTTMGIYVQDRNSVYIRRGHLRGSQANAPMINTLETTTSVLTPPYTFYTDQDTGMYRHEADGLAFAGGGVNKLVLNANGSIQIVTTPATAADENVPVLARNAATGIIEQRVLAELHTHANKVLLDLLTDIGGELAYDGVLVFDSTDYYTTTEIDVIETDIYTAIALKADIGHNHTLLSLSERSYNSLTDQPDLTDLHNHTNKATLDVIPDYAPATINDVMVRDGGGIAWLPLAELSVPRSFVNGSFVETHTTAVTSNGTIITLSVEQVGGGDLIMQFSDGNTVLDCTPVQTIELTAGSNTSPQENYIYIPQSTKVLTKSTSNWPTTEHVKVGYFFVPSATFVQSNGVYINQNWEDHLADDHAGHYLHTAERLRREQAKYFSGIDGNGTDDYTTSGVSTVTVQTTSGVVYQLHRHIYPAKDTSGTDLIHVINHDITPYYSTGNLYDVVNDASGNTLTNKYFNIVLWAVINEANEYEPLCVNLPAGSYNTAADATSDKNGYDVYTMPREFNLDSSTGFLIARLTFRKTGTAWVYHSTVDLRGITPTGATGGVSGAITSFADNQFEIYNVVDNTKIMNFDVSALTTATTRTVTMPDVDLTLINYNGTVAKVDQIEELNTDVGVTIEGNEHKDSFLGVGASINTSYPLYVYNAGSNSLILVESGDANAGIAFKDNTTTVTPIIRASGEDFEILSGAGQIEFSTNSLARLLVSNAGLVTVNYNFKLAAGATVNDIETTLTNDDTHLPTSGAVVTAIAVENLWNRVVTTLSPAIVGDDITTSGTVSSTNAATGLSTINLGLTVNESGGSAYTSDFRVKAATYDAITVDASDDHIVLMSSALGKIGLFGAVPSVQSSGWLITNHIATKVLNANVTTIDEVCDVLGELITELKLKGILGG